MARALTPVKFHSRPQYVGKNYEITLKQSVEALVTSLQNCNFRDSTNFTSEFLEFGQLKADPPLESIWVYASLTSICPSTQNSEPLSRILAIKDLFQLIISCSASCNSMKSIALVAPVVYYLHSLTLDVKGFQLGSKKERKVNGEIKTLIDSILGYVNVCCDGFDGNFDDLEGLIMPLGNLISFWLLDNGVQNKNVQSLRVFFPLLSEDIVKRVSIEGCGMIDLSRFVIAETFFMKLCWKIREDGFGEKTRNELTSWIIGSVTGFRSSYFYVTLLDVLLEPVLPTTWLLNLVHGGGLRKFLFDALILVEYSFLSPESLGQLPVKQAKRVIFTKLWASHQAVELFREHGEHTKAIPYFNAFASSSLPMLIIKWVRSEIGTELSPSEPTGSSPRAFLRWLLCIENRGIKIFDDNMSNFKAAFNSIEKMEQHAGEGVKEKAAPDVFYIDSKGQEEYVDNEDEKISASMSAAFMSAAHSLKSSEKETRKRKSRDGEKGSHIKFIKGDAVDPSILPGERSADLRNDNSGSGSDIENPSSDDDMRI